MYRCMVSANMVSAPPRPALPEVPRSAGPAAPDRALAF